jgi:hypothetical protein
MPETIQCAIHGPRQETFVCNHLLANSVGLGFNRDEPTDERPFPDAWCDDCELIRAAHGEWNEESEKLVKVSLLCSGCYSLARIRNTHPATTLNDLATLRWKCGTCEEWHTGPALDFGYDSPYYWLEEHEKANRLATLLPSRITKRRKTFLTEDVCAIDDEHFFVRGILPLPIIGSAETFCWGVWGSLSRDNFETLLAKDDDPERVELPPMFSWLSNQISEYPETLNLKMYAHVQPSDTRPNFELEHTDHPLAQEFHHGITPERVKAIMLNRLKTNE